MNMRSFKNVIEQIIFSWKHGFEKLNCEILIKNQSRLKVLHKLYYSQRDISATLVEAIFKRIKVQRKTFP